MAVNGGNIMHMTKSWPWYNTSTATPLGLMLGVVMKHRGYRLLEPTPSVNNGTLLAADFREPWVAQGMTLANDEIILVSDWSNYYPAIGYVEKPATT